MLSYSANTDIHIPGVSGARVGLPMAAASAWPANTGAYAVGAVASRLDGPWPKEERTTKAYQEHRAGDFLDNLNRARNLEAVNWLACGILDRVVENVVGTTFRVVPNTKDKDFNRKRRERWTAWAGLQICDVRGLYTFGGMIRQAYRACMRDGDVGIVKVREPYKDGRKWKLRLKLQIIEAERICNPDTVLYGDRLLNGNKCIAGVEMTDAGEPIAYHIKTENDAGIPKWERVLAEDFVFLRRSNRYGSVRGETAFRGEGFRIFEMLSGVLEAVVVAWRAGASQAMIAKRRNPQQAQQGLPAMTVYSGNAPVVGGQAGVEQQKWMPVRSGGVNIVGIDEDLVAFDPKQPQQNMPDALTAFCRILGTKFGLTVERVLLDFSQTTYSGGKMANNQETMTAAIQQEDLAAAAVSNIYRAFIETEEINGELDLPAGIEDPAKHEWIPQRKQSPEPLKDMQAREKGNQIGIDAPSYQAAEDGLVYDDVIEQQAEDEAKRREARRRHGLPEEAAGNGDPTVSVDPETGGVSITPGKGQKRQAGIEAGGRPAGAPATAGVENAVQPLNGAQITAALDVMSRLRDKALTPEAAATLLGMIGVEEAKAKAMTSNLPALNSEAGDVAWKREVLKQLLAVPAARESIYNGVDIEDLISQTGLNPEAGYQAPFIPVVAPAGQLVSGDVVKDPQGDVVGGNTLEELATAVAETKPKTQGNTEQATEARRHEGTKGVRGWLVRRFGGRAAGGG